MAKRMTIVGKADSVHIKRFIEYITVPLCYEITILSDFNRKFIGFYKEKNVKVDAWGINSVVSKLPKFRGFLYLWKVLRRLKKDTSDIIVIQYADLFLMSALSFMRFNKTYIVTYWGSDLYRSNRKILKKASWSVNHATKVIVMTEDMKRKLIDIYGKNVGEKIVVSDFGDSTLEVIDRLSYRKREARVAVLGKSCNKLSITIGYNAIAEQQHEKVLALMNNISEKEKQESVFVIPLSYPKNERYTEKIRTLVDKYGLNCIIIQNYMNEAQMAELYLATDVFINAQVSDALSFSMIEHLYSGSVVWNGSWLKYDFLEDNGIYNRKFDLFQELMGVFKDYKNDKIAVDNTVEDSKNVLREYFSWDACLKRWEDILLR